MKITIIIAMEISAVAEKTLWEFLSFIILINENADM
jgi:hypothetical protein